MTATSCLLFLLCQPSTDAYFPRALSTLLANAHERACTHMTQSARAPLHRALAGIKHLADCYQRGGGSKGSFKAESRDAFTGPPEERRLLITRASRRPLSPVTDKDDTSRGRSPAPLASARPQGLSANPERGRRAGMCRSTLRHERRRL